MRRDRGKVAFVPGVVVPWSVSRHRGGKNPRLKAFQDKVKMFCAKLPLIQAPHAVVIELEFVLKRANSRVRKDLWFPSDFDTTNCQKGVEDALQGVALENDWQVIEIKSHKRYVLGDEEDGTWVRVWQVREPSPRGMGL